MLSAPPASGNDPTPYKFSSKTANDLFINNEKINLGTKTDLKMENFGKINNILKSKNVDVRFYLRY